MKRIGSIAAMLATLALGASVHAENLITNGGFQSTTGGPGQIDYETTVTGWTLPPDGYTFVGDVSQFIAGVPNGEYSTLDSPVTLALWSKSNGGVDTLTASPNGGNFIAQDGAYEDKPIEQTITGLTPGQKYTVSFYWAGAQQTGYYTSTTEAWQVSLGGETEETPVLSNVAKGFTGWQREAMVFTATSSNEVLSFLAVGTPTGQPPFSLLDGVALYAGTPEPATWAFMILGMAGIGAIVRRRRARSATVAAVPAAL